VTEPFTITLEYPPTTRNEPRYGHDRPPHSRLARLLGEHEVQFARVMDTIARYADDLRRIPVTPDGREPGWTNGFLPGLDAAALYTFIRDRSPRRYVEVGAGNSTKFAARAKRDGCLRTTLVSIDPEPRAEIDALCDTVARTSLEEADLSVFRELEPRDVVFFDGSHRVFMNSDTTVFFLDVLPELPEGVLVGIHDIRLPDDYAAAYRDRWYSEQYLLACWLLGGGEGMRLELAAAYVSHHTRLLARLDPLWATPGLENIERHGDAFWFTTAGRR
jgi:methyltransferase family protein